MACLCSIGTRPASGVLQLHARRSRGTEGSTSSPATEAGEVVNAQLEGAGASRPSGFLPGDIVYFVWHSDGGGACCLVLSDDEEFPDLSAEELEIGGHFGSRIDGPCVVIQAENVDIDTGIDKRIHHLEFVALGKELTLHRGFPLTAYTWASAIPVFRKQRQASLKAAAEHEAFMLANPDYDALEELRKVWAEKKAQPPTT